MRFSKKIIFLQQTFNMIEVVIALMIVMVVLVSVIALLPKGIQSNQDAISRIAAADAVDQFFNHYSALLQQDWDFIRKLPRTKPVLSSTREQELIFSTENLLTSHELEINFAAPSPTTRFVDLQESQATGIFKVRHKSAAQRIDFEAIMAAWAEFPEIDMEGVPAELGDAAEIRLKVEVSWPASVAYEYRNKKIYEYQVFRPDQLSKEASSLFSVPCKSAWAIEQSSGSPKLVFYVLGNDSNGSSRSEGNIVGLDSGVKVDALTVLPDGTIYFVNNAFSEGQSTLYRINPGEIDHNASTVVHVVKVGKMGVSVGSDKEIVGLAVIGRKLYAVSYKSKEVFEVHPQTGVLSKVATINQGGSFQVGGIAVTSTGVYLVELKGSSPRIWRFNSFPGGDLTQVMTLNNAGDLVALAGHPNGKLYAGNNSRFYEIDPVAGSSAVLYSQSTNIGDFAFYQSHEMNCFSNDCEQSGILTGTISLNPTGNPDFSLEMITEDGTVIVRNDLMHNPTFVYNGKVRYVRFKPKCQGKQNLTLNGEPYQLDNQTVYVLQSSVPFSIRLFNQHASSGQGQGNTHGNAMGKWAIDLNNAPLTINDCDQSWEQDPPTTEEEPYEPPFDISGGKVIPKEPVNTTFRVLGCALVSGGKNCYVTTSIHVDGKVYTPFGNPNNPYQGNINDGKPHFYDAGLLAGGVNVWVTGYSYLPNGKFYMKQASAPSNQNVLVLKNGDNVPNIPGFSGQDSLEVFIRDYIDTTTKTVRIQDNQVILLFELGTTNLNSPAADFQDMVMLVTMTPPN